jgi:hypothetical protein
MELGLDLGCRNSQRSLEEGAVGHDGRQAQISGYGLGIALFDVSKTAELALNPIVIAMPIVLGADEFSVGDEIAILDPLAITWTGKGSFVIHERPSKRCR